MHCLDLFCLTSSSSGSGDDVVVTRRGDGEGLLMILGRTDKQLFKRDIKLHVNLIWNILVSLVGKGNPHFKRHLETH